jgi:membrane protein
VDRKRTIEQGRARAIDAAARAEGTVPGAAARRFLDDDMSERAAGLAFYALFSSIPIVVIAAALFGLIGDQDAVDSLTKSAADAGASSSVAGVFRSLLGTAIAGSPESASTVGLIGLGTLIYGASKAFTDAGRALDRISGGVVVTRSLRKRATDLVWTVVLIVFGLLAAVILFVTGDLLRLILDAIGLDDVKSIVWEIARWPLIAAVAVLAVALVRWAGPTSGAGSFRPFRPGALMTVALWMATTAGYSIYLTAGSPTTAGRGRSSRLTTSPSLTRTS